MHGCWDGGEGGRHLMYGHVSPPSDCRAAPKMRATRSRTPTLWRWQRNDRRGLAQESSLRPAHAVAARVGWCLARGTAAAMSPSHHPHALARPGMAPASPCGSARRLGMLSARQHQALSARRRRSQAVACSAVSLAALHRAVDKRPRTATRPPCHADPDTGGGVCPRFGGVVEAL